MSADPPRKRRSSLSEHFQRVFHVDSADKKRRSLAQDASQTTSHFSWAPGDDHHAKSETTAPQSVPDETGISSLTYSSNLRITSVSTPRSTPSVHQFALKDGTSTPQPVTAINNPNAERNKICSSPTWGKENARKERRATKRLEAERKELEKRLIQLEESQFRLDNGIYERNSRRLTKKNPTGSSERSSSTGSSRFRSSSITAFFTGSRRASRSRASSMNGDSRHSSTETPNGNPPSPPSIPLALPERFGADVSRELANRSGTTLVPASQLTSTKFSASQSHLPHSSPKLQRALHSTMKSDDLRENWRMAEEWKKGNEVGTFSTESLSRELEVLAGIQFQQHADLGQYPASVNTKHGRNSFARSNHSTGSLNVGKLAQQPIGLLLKKGSSSENNANSHDPSTTRITAARQLRDFSNAVPETKQNFRNTNDSHSLTSLLDSISSNIPRKSRPEATSPTHSRTYKSSPLAMNPNTSEERDRSMNGNSSVDADMVQVPQPLRIGKSPQLAPTRSPDTAQNQYHADNGHSNSPQQIPGEHRRSHVIPPPKHPGRRSLDENIPKRNSINDHVPGLLISGGGAALRESRMSEVQLGPTQSEAVRCRLETRDLNEVDRPRPSSSCSSQRASSYDTADEEVLDVLSKPSNHVSSRSAKSNAKKPVNPTKRSAAVNNPSLSPPNPRNSPPLAPGGSLSMLRRKPMQKVKPPRADDVVAKLFVICCQCKYWHDMPSEIYAKLACPERLPSDSRLVRTFSRRNSGRNSIFSADPNDPRRISVPRRLHPPNEPNNRSAAGDVVPPTQPTQLYRPQCCWCGHSMGKTCCQGWSALVHMRGRYH